MNNLKTRPILIIEDEVDILLSLKDFLELEGYEILTAENGAIAMDLLRVDNIPQLILLDMKMPVMDGWEFAAAFRDKFGQACPIIVMSAAADVRQRALDINAFDYIEKPFHLDHLLKKLSSFKN